MSQSARPAPARRTLALNDGDVSYLEWVGTGPVIHFAHANGFNAETYSALLAPLAPHFRVLASDARGHGFTNLPATPELARGWTILRDDLSRTLDALHPDPIILAGHSLGAISSLMVAAFQPKRVRGLILIEPVLVPAIPQGNENPGPSLAIATKKRRARFASIEAALDNYRGKGAFASWPDSVLGDYLKSGLRRDGDGVRLSCTPEWEAAIYERTPLGITALMESVTCPVSVIYGDRDSTVPGSEIERIRRNPKHQIVQIPDSSHFLPMEKPERVREEIVRFAETL